MPTVDLGFPLYYVEQGEGEPVLFISGLFASGENDFSAQLSELSHSFRIIAPDPRGYGRSRPPERDFPPDFLQRDANDMCNLMEEIGHDSFHLAGWSDGAAVAMLIALSFPTRVKKMVLWGANSFISESDMEVIKHMRKISDWPRVTQRYLRNTYGDNLDEIWESYCKRVEENFAAGGEICRSRLSEIACPTLIIHGANDMFVSEQHSLVIRDGIPNSRLRVFTDGDHGLHTKKATEFNSLIKEFLLEED